MASIYDIDLYDNNKNTYVKNEVVVCGPCINDDASTATGRFYYNLGYSIAPNGNTNGVRPSQSGGSAYWGGYTPYGVANAEIPHFFWVPSYAPNISSEPKVEVLSFGDGYEQRSPQGINNTLLKLDLIFDKRNEGETTAISHFLHARGAQEAFAFTPPSPYSVPKKFICRSWDVTMTFSNNYSVKANFEEVVE